MMTQPGKMQVADHLRADLALDALEMAIWSRRERIDGELVHHSDRSFWPRVTSLGRNRPSGSKTGTCSSPRTVRSISRADNEVRHAGAWPVPVSAVTHGDSRSFTGQPAARLTSAAAGPPVASTSFASWGSAFRSLTPPGRRLVRAVDVILQLVKSKARAGRQVR
jgi:hypothetical protein